MATNQIPVLVEVFLTDSMIAAGMEAKREAKTLYLEKGEIVREIYLATEGEESLH